MNTFKSVTKKQKKNPHIFNQCKLSKTSNPTVEAKLNYFIILTIIILL